MSTRPCRRVRPACLGLGALVALTVLCGPAWGQGREQAAQVAARQKEVARKVPRPVARFPELLSREESEQALRLMNRDLQLLAVRPVEADPVHPGCFDAAVQDEAGFPIRVVQK